MEKTTAIRSSGSTKRQLTIDWDLLQFEAQRLDPCQPVLLATNAKEVLETRYFRRDDKGQIIEDYAGLCERVATALAKGEWAYGREKAVNLWASRYYDALLARDALTNSPILMNAGLPNGQLFACFVVDIQDSLSSILSAVSQQAVIQKFAGGTGFDFSTLRPEDDPVTSTGGVASGPSSFLLLNDAVTAVIQAGGKRRGANMGVLRVDHPDIVRWVDLKRDGLTAQNFNLSVFVTDQFMRAAESGGELSLVNPRTGKVVKKIPAAELLYRMATNAWATGDPGMLFADMIARCNPTPEFPIRATNPCGEVPLLSGEACVLASINLSKMVHDVGARIAIDYAKLAYNARLLVRLLDDAIEVSAYPNVVNRRMVRDGNRKIGIGVMGFSDLLIKLGIPYASVEAISLAENVMKFVQSEARQASCELAVERGVFGNWEKSIFAKDNIPMRNATVTSIAPTGTIAIIAECSPSIEPLFALAFHRKVLNGRVLMEVNPLFIEHAKRHGYYSESLISELKEKGCVGTIDTVPEADRRLFATALEIEPIWHLRMQAAFQKHCCNAVSKTINLPETATPDDVLDIFTTAWKLGVKGTTVYRYGSKSEQVMNLGSSDLSDEAEQAAPNSCPRGGGCEH